MNALQEIKSKAVEFECRHRIVPKVLGLSVALQLGEISVFAEDGGSTSGTVDISTVTSTLTSSLNDLATKVGVACAGVVGAGLTIFAIKWVFRTVISFFKAIGK